MLNWKNETLSYLLGVVQGDGTVSTRSICITVGDKEVAYKNTILQLWRDLGYKPKLYKIRSTFRIDVNSRDLTDEFRPFKQNGLWRLPPDINLSEWVAGIFDTDGCVSNNIHTRQIVIVLKRSGNLNFVQEYFSSLGMVNVSVNDTTNKFNNKIYPTETLRLSSQHNILLFAKHVPLRHPRKAERLANIITYIEESRSKIPRWKQVADFLGEPKTWKEIARQFDLTKDQVDSVMQIVKAKTVVEILPPPEALTRYRVKSR